LSERDIYFKDIIYHQTSTAQFSAKEHPNHLFHSERTTAEEGRGLGDFVMMWRLDVPCTNRTSAILAEEEKHSLARHQRDVQGVMEESIGYNRSVSVR
jgi:hypothetical protein